MGSTTPIWTTPPKSAKSSTKQLLHKSPIHPPKTAKDRLKNLSPKKLEQLKHKTTSSHWSIWENTAEHQSEQWKTRKLIKTAINQNPYSPLNIKNKVTYKNE